MAELHLLGQADISYAFIGLNNVVQTVICVKHLLLLEPTEP